jgi:hypothetical protein
MLYGMNRLSQLNLIAGCFLFLWASASGNEQVMEKKNSELLQGGSNVNVGAYYYPWYRGSGQNLRRNQWRNVMRLHLVPPQEPKCGLYDSANPASVQEHIEQMGGFDNPTYKNWISDLKYIKETYFDNPNYLKINGKPVIFFYLSREYFRNKGQEALEQMRKEFPELYLVGDDVYFGNNPAEKYKAEWAQNFDAVTAYDVYGQSIGKFGATQQAVDFLATNYRQAKETANSL